MAKKDNKEKNPVGRPLKYKTVKELDKKINEYFSDEMEKPFTVTGLALYLDMTPRGLLEYENREEFFPTVKKAKFRIEDHLNKNMLNGKYNTTGAIFNLKNNFGWTDKQQVEHSGETTQNVKAEVKSTVDIEKLSVEELKQLESIINKSSE